MRNAETDVASFSLIVVGPFDEIGVVAGGYIGIEAQLYEVAKQ